MFDLVLGIKTNTMSIDRIRSNWTKRVTFVGFRCAASSGKMRSGRRVLSTRQALASGLNAEVTNVVMPRVWIDPLCRNRCDD